MFRAIVLMLLSATALIAQEGDQKRCNNYFSTPAKDKCNNCAQANAGCSDRPDPKVEDKKCRSYCNHGCGCIGKCTSHMMPPGQKCGPKIKPAATPPLSRHKAKA